MDEFAKFGLTQAPAGWFAAPLVQERHANLECHVVCTRVRNCDNFFVLELVKAWIAPVCKVPRTMHRRGHGVFMVACDTIKLASRMK